jgi:hypothetical protein
MPVFVLFYHLMVYKVPTNGTIPSLEVMWEAGG